MGGVGRVALFCLFLGPSSPESSLALSVDKSLMPGGAPWGREPDQCSHLCWAPRSARPGCEALRGEIRGISEKMCLGRSISNLPIAP